MKPYGSAVILLIFCIFYMIVIARQKDIAIIKSCGVSNCAVAQIFIYYAGLVGITGSVLAVILGGLVIDNINAIEEFIRAVFGMKLWQSSVYMFTAIPQQVNFEAVIYITAAAVLASILGAVIPAISAARLNPVRILRYE